MAGFFPLRDLSGRKIPGMANVFELPKDMTPAHYEDGVYVIGEVFIPVADMDRLSPEDRTSLLSHPYILLYGHRGREMRAVDDRVLLKRVAVAVAACLLLAHPLLGRLFS